jgi:hypothetical protein
MFFATQWALEKIIKMFVHSTSEGNNVFFHLQLVVATGKIDGSGT